MPTLRRFASPIAMPYASAPRKFLIGLALYARQIELSIDRTHGDWQGLRQFYKPRPQPDDLAVLLLQAEARNRSRWNLLQTFMANRPVPERDRWMMARLLFDFSAILRGYEPATDDLYCLRYCLSQTTSIFYRRLGMRRRLEKLDLHHFNRTGHLPAGKEINTIVGDDWLRL